MADTYEALGLIRQLSLKDISICVAVLLVILNPLGRLATGAPVRSQEESFTFSNEALAAAKRFSSTKERAFADLEIVLNELQKFDRTTSPIKVGYRPISRQQLINLLGSPTYESEDGQVVYGNSFGTTAFFFEAGRLKSFLTLGEPNYWYSFEPRWGIGKRLWYRAVRWAGKLKRFLF